MVPTATRGAGSGRRRRRCELERSFFPRPSAFSRRTYARSSRPSLSVPRADLSLLRHVSLSFAFGDSYTQESFNSTTLTNGAVSPDFPHSHPLRLHRSSLTRPSPVFTASAPQTSANGPNWIQDLTEVYNISSPISRFNVAFAGANIDQDIITGYSPTIKSVKGMFRSSRILSRDSDAAVGWAMLLPELTPIPIVDTFRSSRRVRSLRRHRSDLGPAEGDVRHVDWDQRVSPTPRSLHATILDTMTFHRD